jgi:hypothetical protein
MRKQLKPQISNEEMIAWEIDRHGHVTVRILWRIQSSHPRVHKNHGTFPHVATKTDVWLRGANVSVKLTKGWQVEQLVREVGAVVANFQAGAEAGLVERLFEIAKSAYACPEWLRFARTPSTDKTLNEADRLLCAKLARTEEADGTPTS